MNRHLIALDLDGTLLNPQKEISPATMQALHTLQQNGHVITLCTGRCWPDASMLIRRIGGSVMAIIANGASIRDDTGKELQISPFSREMLAEILRICRRYNCCPSINTPSTEYYGEELANFLQLMDAHHIARLVTPDKRQVYLSGYGDVVRVMGQREGRIIKVVFYATQHDTILEIQKELADCQMFESYLSSSFDDTHFDLEVNAKGISKGSALQTLAQRLGIPQQQVVAFGDGSNDLEMLDYAGTGIAMGSASDMVKSHADLVTLDCGHDGIPAALKKLHLI